MEFIRINNRKNFLLEEVPTINPHSRKYLSWWKEQTMRCIEGFWSIDDENVKVNVMLEHPEYPDKSFAWRWLTPTAYFYCNYGTILANPIGATSGAKIPMRPSLDDIEWEFGYNWMEARGFSGFEDDPDFSCNIHLLNKDLTDKDLLRKCENENGEIIDYLQKNYFNSSGKRKQFVPCRQYVRQLFSKNMGRPVYANPPENLMILATRDGGKAIACDSGSYVWTTNGRLQLKDIKVNDKIYGADGELTNVTGIFHQDPTNLFRVTFMDGRYLDVHPDHLWEVKKFEKKGLIIDTKTMYEKFMYQGNDKGGNTYIYSVKQNKPINYPEQDLPIHPYILGAMLGDGTMTTNTPKIACNDLDILDKFKELLPEYKFNYDKHSNNNYNIVWKKRACINNKSPFVNALRDNNLVVKGNNKYIPDIYKTSSVEQRLELIKGLMDTDGSANKDGACEFTNKSKKLIYDLAEVFRSLGIKCQIGIDNRTGCEGNIKGHKYIRGIYYRLYINTTIPIFHLKRKLDKQINKKYRSAHDYTSIINIEKLRKKRKSLCITIDNLDHCFVTDDYIVTHNSYLTANQVIAHELIFDGIRRYSPDNVNNPPLAEIVVGASISDKSKDLLNKVSLTMNNLKGAWKKGTNEEIPSPFFKHMSGSITPNKDWEHKYKKKIGSDWKDIGTGSKIKHRIFTTENPEAAAGGRPGTIVIEEVGLVSNILTIHQSNDAAQNNSGEKFGSSVYIGTAGNMEKIVEAEMIFNDPKGYNFLAFENQEENDRGTEICWFIPATHMARKFKDANGNTMVKEATEHFLKRRALKEKSASKRGLEGEMMNYPLKPSEMFLNKTNNAFPVADIKVRIRDLMSTLNDELKLTLKGRMNLSEDGGVSFEKLNIIPIREFPLKKEDINIEGCVEIFELPMKDGEGKVPSGLYIAALDPVDDDGNDDNSRSLQSTFIMNTLTDRVVAEYSGRTKFAKEYYEQVRRMLIFYNATILYENQKKGFFTYFDNKNCLYLLEDTPPALRDVDIQKGTIIGNKGKGIYATDTINYWGRQQLLPNYLELPAYGNNDIMNLQTFKSLAGLKEMIYYNGKLNTDRISSLGLLMIHRELKLKFKTDTKKKIHKITSDPFFNRHLTKGMRKYEEVRKQLMENDQT